MNRLKLFRRWYCHLRREADEMYGSDRWDLSWYAQYNRFNCIMWAWSNSATHETDGSYRKF